MKNYRKPHRIKKKKPVYKNRIFTLSILFAVLFFGIFYLSCFFPYFQIEKINISGNYKVSADNIKNIVQSQIDQKILFLPSKSIFLADINEASRDILNGFPQIAEINIKRDFFDELDVVVIERDALANFCQNNSCFLIDKNGIIFEESSSTTDFIKITDKASAEVFLLGETAMEKEQLFKILDIYTKLNTDLKIPVEEFTVSPEDRLIVLTREGWEVYFYLKGDIDWQMTKLKAVLDEKIPQAKRKDLQYIELRFENLAPFKYRVK